MRIKVTAAFVAFATMVTGFFVYVADLGVRVRPPDDRINLTMDVADINSLVVGSNVLLRGIPVGKVSKIDGSLSHVTIHFFVDGKFAVPRDTVVRLENLSALGESYLELEPPGTQGPMYEDGQRISAASIIAPRSITELGASVVRTLDQLDPAQLANVVNEADEAFPDPYAVLPNIERAGTVLNNTVLGLDGQGRQALVNLQSLLENAGFVGSLLVRPAADIKALGPYMQKLWQIVVNQNLRMDMPGSVYTFGKFMQRILTFLDKRAQDLRVLTEPLTPNIQAIASALRNVDSSRILTNLLAATPPDGAIELHVALPPPPQGAPQDVTAPAPQDTGETAPADGG